jgi:hypothetical protein
MPKELGEALNIIQKNTAEKIKPFQPKRTFKRKGPRRLMIRCHIIDIECRFFLILYIMNISYNSFKG